MNIFDGPRHKKRAHSGTAPGAGALATGRRGLPSVETRIFIAMPAWRPPGSWEDPLGSMRINAYTYQQK